MKTARKATKIEKKTLELQEEYLGFHLMSDYPLDLSEDSRR